MRITQSPSLLAYPIVRVVAAQLLGGVITIIVTAGLSKTDYSLPVWALCGIWGLVAATVSTPLGLRRWWLPVQAVAPLTMWLLLGINPPDWLFPVIIVGLLGVYWNAVGEGVPLYLSNRTTRRALAGMLADKPGVRMIDLGSGLAGTLLHLARSRPDGHFVGVETAPLVFLLSRLRILISGPSNVAVKFHSIWRTDLADYDLVYCFLSPVPMARLFAKAQRQMKPGSLFVSNSFEVPDHPADEILELDDRRRTRLLIWRL